MAKVDPRDFLLNTDYEMDKIIYAHDEERTVSSVTTITIPHTLPTVPLLFGIWSTSPDYTNSHELGDYDDPWNQNLRCYAKADLNNVYITLTPQSVNGSYVSTTFYVRVFGFEPYSDHEVPGWTEPSLTYKKFPSTSKYAKEFIINTDYNYLKLLRAGDPFTWQSDHAEYVHKLGYVPQILLWWTFGFDDDNGNIEFAPTDYFSYSDGSTSSYKDGVIVDNQNISYYAGTTPLQIETRIYADEA